MWTTNLAIGIFLLTQGISARKCDSSFFPGSLGLPISSAKDFKNHSQDYSCLFRAGLVTEKMCPGIGNGDTLYPLETLKAYAAPKPLWKHFEVTKCPKEDYIVHLENVIHGSTTGHLTRISSALDYKRTWAVNVFEEDWGPKTCMSTASRDVMLSAEMRLVGHDESKQEAIFLVHNYYRGKPILYSYIKFDNCGFSDLGFTEEDYTQLKEQRTKNWRNLRANEDPESSIEARNLLISVPASFKYVPFEYRNQNAIGKKNLPTLGKLDLGKKLDLGNLQMNSPKELLSGKQQGAKPTVKELLGSKEIIKGLGIESKLSVKELIQSKSSVKENKLSVKDLLQRN